MKLTTWSSVVLPVQDGSELGALRYPMRRAVRNTPGRTALQVLRSLPLVAAMLAVSACAPTLSGHLVNGSGLAVSGADARVNVASLEGDNDHRTNLVCNVDGDGRYLVKEPLPPGEYLVEALVPGYAPTSVHVTLPTANPVDLDLKPSTNGLTNGAAPLADPLHVSGLAHGDRGLGGASLMPPNL